MFHAQILTLFPEFFDSPLSCSIPKRAIAAGLVAVDCIQIRDFATDKHHTVDDTPYGGGPGMLMKPDPVVASIRAARERQPDTHVVMLTPSGTRFTQAKALEYTEKTSVTLLCGRYEGFDERICDYVDEQLSLGDYVLSGGEVPAMVLIEGMARLIPGVLGNAESADRDSFQRDELEGPQYTRPARFRDLPVPEVLRSGDHAAVARWRAERAKEITRRRRPDLIRAASQEEES